MSWDGPSSACHEMLACVQSNLPLFGGQQKAAAVPCVCTRAAWCHGHSAHAASELFERPVSGICNGLETSHAVCGASALGRGTGVVVTRRGVLGVGVRELHVRNLTREAATLNVAYGRALLVGLNR